MVCPKTYTMHRAPGFLATALGTVAAVAAVAGAGRRKLFAHFLTKR